MKYLNSDPGILGGELVIKGTRIPITLILQLLTNHTFEDVHDMYRWVDKKTLKGAIDEAISLLENFQHA